MSQTTELNRVSNNIRGHILTFLKIRLATVQPFFCMQDLHEYIRKNARIAPASPDRVLRQLRKDGKVEYRVISRAASKYLVLTVCD